MQSYYQKRSPHFASRLSSNVMIMKILTTMRSKLIIISILYPLVKLMTSSQLLETFELFNPVFDKEVFHIELPLLQYFLQKHVRDEFLPFKRESMADYKVAVYPVEFAVLGNHNLYFSCHIRLVYGFLSRREVSSSSTSSILGRADFKFSGIALLNW